MRLCFIGNYTNIHTQRWAGFFAKKGHDVHVISTMPIESTDEPGIKLHYLFPYRTGYYFLDLIVSAISAFWQVNKLKRLIERICPDIVHVHYINDAAFLALMTGFSPIVMTAWGSDILVSPENSWIRKKVVQYVVNKADLITCDADHMKRKLIYLGAKPENVDIIFFGTDVKRFQAKYRNQQFRSQIAISGGPLIISIRSLEPIYDIESLIRSIPIVCGQFPDAKFLIGGSGSLRIDLEELTKNLGVRQNICFLGNLNQEELPTYLASSDIYVSTALSDGGIAASTAEAMASELPVVITDVGDNRQWVEDGKEGFLVPPSDPPSVAKGIIKLLESGENRKRMGSKGRHIIIERNNLYTEMGKMENLYQSIGRQNNNQHQEAK